MWRQRPPGSGATMPLHHPPGAGQRTDAMQRQVPGGAEAQDALAQRHHEPGDVAGSFAIAIRAIAKRLPDREHSIFPTGQYRKLGKGSFMAPHLADLSPNATAGQSPEFGATEVGTYRQVAHRAIETLCRAARRSGPQGRTAARACRATAPRPDRQGRPIGNSPDRPLRPGSPSLKGQQLNRRPATSASSAMLRRPKKQRGQLNFHPLAIPQSVYL
jgi:hypothetical protein